MHPGPESPFTDLVAHLAQYDFDQHETIFSIIRCHVNQNPLQRYSSTLLQSLKDEDLGNLSAGGTIDVSAKP